MKELCDAVLKGAEQWHVTGEHKCEGFAGHEWHICLCGQTWRVIPR